MSDPDMTARECGLASRLTDEFLTTLIEAARVVGWSVDYLEVRDFVVECYRMAGKDSADVGTVEPYSDDELTRFRNME